jgi:uncharacterized protein (TIGR00156 family)
MKMKHLVCLTVLLALTGLTVYAQGYTGPGLEPITVTAAKRLRDNSPVVLQGKIERFLGDEKYTFTDASGTITVDIDDRLWYDLSVNQDDTVVISGEVDKDFLSIEIDVRSIQKLDL